VERQTRRYSGGDEPGRLKPGGYMCQASAGGEGGR